MDRWHLFKQAAKEGGKAQTRLHAAAQAEMVKRERERMACQKEFDSNQQLLQKQQQEVLEEHAARLSKLESERLFQIQMQDWVTAAVEPGESQDYVKVCDLYKAFCQSHTSTQMNKKTKKSAKQFEDTLHCCLQNYTFKTKHQYRSNGKNITLGKVFMSVRQK